MLKNTLKYLFYLFYVFLLASIFVREYVNLQLFAFAIFGIYLFMKGSKKEFNTKIFFYLGIGILLSWILPLITYDVPLGYDPGLYKYLYDSGFDLTEQNVFEENWMHTAYPLGISYLFSIFETIGFSADFVISYLFYLLVVLLFFMFYLFVKEYTSEEIANLSAFLFSTSIVVFYIFFMNYYKNVLGLILIFLCLILLNRKKYFLLVLCGAFLFGTHRPSFVIYGLLHLFLLLFFYEGERGKVFVSGVLINLFGVVFYVYNYDVMLLSVLEATSSSIVNNSSSGSFLSVVKSLEYSIVFLPFFLIGFFKSFKKYKFIFLWFILCGIMIILEVFFYKRLIIFLIFPFIIISAIGMVELFGLVRERVFRFFIVVIICVFFLSYSASVKPLISNETLGVIKGIDEGDYGADVGSEIIVLHKYYSPWIKGYANGDVIAPGLFDENEFNKTEWREIWAGNLTYFYEYDDGLIFVGNSNVMNVSLFDSDDCFEEVYFDDEVRLYRIGCE